MNSCADTHLKREAGDVPRLVPPVIVGGSISVREQPILDGGQVTLRRWEAADRQGLVDAFSDPEIQRWHLLRIDSLAEADAWIERTREGWRSETVVTWAISAGGQPEAVGRISIYLHDLCNGLGEITYWVTPRARGSGVATDALVTIGSWALDEMGMHRLEVVHSVGNPSSCRVATKASFQAEGTRSSALRHADGWHDMHVHRRIAAS